MIANDSKGPFFSLILGTLDRPALAMAFVNALVKQEFQDWELLIIDQTLSNSLEKHLSYYNFPSEKIRYFHVNFQGISNARNYALEFARGRWIGFPDDDCIYPERLLQQLYERSFSYPDLDGFSILMTDAEGHFSAGGYMAYDAHLITRNNLWRSAVSAGIFLKHDAIGNIRFDTKLGVGANTMWGSGEESDFLL